MHKAVFALERSEEMSQAEFEDYWTAEHAPIAAEGVPGLLKYTVSFPHEPADAPYDGMAELYFESPEALGEAMESEAMAEAVADVPNFADPDSALQLVVEEHVQVDRT